MADHRLVDVHRVQARHIEARQPHVDDDDDLELGVNLLELDSARNAVLLRSDDLAPRLGVLVALGHHDLYDTVLLPRRTLRQEPLVDLNGDRTRIGDDHRLAGKVVPAEPLVVPEDIRHERFDRVVVPEQGLHLGQVALGRGDHLFIRGNSLVLTVD